MTLPVGDPANIVRDGGYEAATTPWTLGGIAEITSAFTVYEGTKALRLRARRALAGTINQTSSATQVMRAAVGATYRPSVRVRKTNATDGAVSAVLNVRFDTDNDGFFNVSLEIIVASIPTNDWTEVVAPFTFVAAADSVRVTLDVALSPSGIDADTWWIVDNLIVLPEAVVAPPNPGVFVRVPPNGPGISVFQRSHFDEICGTLVKEREVVEDRSGLVRRRTDVDDLATGDYEYRPPRDTNDEEP